MYAIEFETTVTNRYLELKDFEKFINKNVKVIVLVNNMHDDHDIKKPDISYIEKLKNRHVKVDKNIDIDNIMQEMSNGLS